MREKEKDLEFVCAMVLDYFNEWIDAIPSGMQAADDKVVKYGLDTLGVKQDTLIGAMYTGFVNGFNAGLAFVSRLDSITAN